MGRRALATTTYEEAETKFLEEEVRAWCASNRDRISAEASHRYLEEFFFQLLQQNAELNAADIVDIARLKHPPADAALRHYIERETEGRRLDAMPPSLPDFLRVTIKHVPPLSVRYPSRSPHIVSQAARDVAFGLWVLKAHRRCPFIPLKKSRKRQRSVVAIVGGAFGIEEIRAGRIFRSQQQIVERIVTFLTRHRVHSGALSIID